MPAWWVAAAWAAPDVSGTWTVAPPAPGPRGDLGSGWGSPLTVTQDAAQVTVEYAFFAPGELQSPLRFTYALDGTETKAVVYLGRGAQVQRSRARWEGERLVVVTTHDVVDPATGAALTMDVTRTLTLSSKSTLVVETSRPGVLGGTATSTKVVYRRP
jgi:hypothetical protein